MGRGSTAAVKTALPPGVEIHGKSLRVCFSFRGVRCREALGLEPTAKNIKYAANFRSTILHQISTRSFKYHEHFPDSQKVKLFDDSEAIKSITLGELRDLYKDTLALTRTDYSLTNYGYAMNVIIPLLGGEKRIVSSLQHCDIDTFRVELRNGRKISTFNERLGIADGMFSFAKKRNYTAIDLIDSDMYLKEDSDESIPDPLEFEEFNAVIAACSNEFYQHIFTLMIYTGLRSGEAASLAWEDVDFENKNVTVRRNVTIHGFKLPKNFKTRQIDLMPPALDVLKKMRFLTELYPAKKIDVVQRDKTISKQQNVRFIFNPLCFTRHQNREPFITPKSLSRTWKKTLKSAGVRHRRLHQTRHTYACWSLGVIGNPVYVADQMGHSDFSMLTKVYARWMPTNSKKESDRIWAALQASRM